MIRTYLNNGIDYLEDLYRTNYALSLFDKFKNKLPIKDINQIKSLNQLEDLVDEFDVKDAGQTNKDVIKEIKTNETEYWYRGPEGIILVPLTERSSCFWGKNTRWCTASTKSRNVFDSYNRDGKLFVIIDKTDNEKYQLHLRTGEIMNSKDEYINTKRFLDNNSWIFNSLLPYITKTPETAFKFALNIYGDFPQGEPIISTNAEFSYYYAEKILNDRFRLGEPAIATNPKYSYNYALLVLRKRFPLGEEAIKTDPILWNRYMEFLQELE